MINLYKKPLAIVLLVIFLNQLFLPVTLYALTTGPSQPEVASFEPIGTTDMVNLFTGDFTYNIPLLDVEGYPINLAYHSGITMDAEASWCGLGWNINPGAINRNMRGLPDDFKGDLITKEFNMKDNKTWGLDLGTQVKYYGIGLGLSGGIYQNNYTGFGTSLGTNVSMSSGFGGKSGMTAGIGLNLSSRDGATVSASVNFSMKESQDRDDGGSMGLSASTNSRTGFKGLTISTSYSKGQYANPNQSITIGSGYPTFMPTIQMPLENSSFTFNASAGGEIYGVHPNMSFSGFYSSQKLSVSSKSSPGYGYANSQYGYNDNTAVLDFNREKDGPFVKHMLTLPIPSATYDLFSMNAQGMNGQFRAYRSDVGLFYDPMASITTKNNMNAGLELGGGNLAHSGYTLVWTDVNTQTEKWVKRNKIMDYVDFASPGDQQPDFEQVYFKNTGEKTINDADYQNSIGNSDLMKVDIVHDDAYANRQFNKYSATNVPIGSIELNTLLKKTKREKRQDVFSAVNGLEAYFTAVSKNISSFEVNSSPFDVSNLSQWSRLERPYHHYSEMTVLGKDGKRFVYGIPTYINHQKEATFSVADPGTYPSSGIVTYDTDDNTPQNDKGQDNYFNAEIMPPFAYSYLLTEVLSPDYIDITGNGVTGDDYGTAYKFNYSRTNPNYHWRVPFDEHSANYNQGYASNKEDDKGSYLYGHKELWYSHSIESKNFVARFYLEKRNDGYGANGEEGGRNSADSLLRIKEIRLYSKIDLLKNAEPVPIKTVHFEYDYSLCRNVDNNIYGSIPDSVNGKLTLKKLWFTYGNNEIGKLNAYEFQYNSYNPDYNIKKYDRWGNFMDNKNIDPTNYPDNVYYPYTCQLKDSTDKWSSAWHLTAIDLPSGGTISVSYESKQYAYVQDKRAAQMFRIDRFGPTKDYPSVDGELFDPASKDANFFLFIKVSDTTTISDNAEITKRYLEGLKKLYFKCLIDVNNDNNYEYVPGYASVKSIGIPTNKTSVDGYIYVELDKVTDGKMGDVNPIAKAAWQFIRLNLPELAYPGSQNDGDWKGLILSLTATVLSAKELFSRFDRRAQSKKWGCYINCPKSWIRLQNPNYAKLGGGCRVKTIKMNDNWNTMTGSAGAQEYGQQYDYTTQDKAGNVMSSGVAAYEPIIGGDEIALRNPLPYETGEMLVPKTHHYSETPLGEALYPAPVIGYSKVTVSSINHVEGSPSKTGTGKTIHRFYTARDFPVINKYTDMEVERFKIPAILALFGVSGREYITATQGFSVEVNDMHGKEKSVEVFNEAGNLVSAEKYYYKTDQSNHLENEIDVLKSDSTISTALVGKDIDLWMDMRQQQTDIISPGVNINLELMLYGYFPVVVPPIIPKYSHEVNRFRSVSAVKYIQHYGILDKVEKINQGSKVTTKNLLFDSETAEPLLTETTNEFDDPIYTFTYPAHWAYDGTGPAYRNLRCGLKNITVSAGNITASGVTPENYLTSGDEVLLVGGSNTVIVPVSAWVHELASGSVKLIDKNGMPISINASGGGSLSVNLIVVKSGRKNLATASIGNLVMVKNSPISAALNKLDLSGQTTYTRITQASVREFNDTWKKSCREVSAIDCDTIKAWPIYGECLTRFWTNIIRYDTTHVKSIMTSGYVDTLTIGAIIKMDGGGSGGCSSALDSINFYSLSDPYTPATPYQVAFGDSCFINITSLLAGNAPVKLDSINHYIAGVGGCVTLCHRYLDSTGTSYLIDSLAEACISCLSCQYVCKVNTAEDDTINPFLQGMANNWHPWKDWTYYAKRKPLNNTASRTRNDGHFEKFSQFWKYNGTSKMVENNSAADPNWTRINKVTLINNSGADIENQDALNKYSAALYSFNESLPKAIADNAPIRNIANDNFEDYFYKPYFKKICVYEHFDFKDQLDDPYSAITDKYAHTGNHSIKLHPNTDITVTRPLITYPESPVLREPGNVFTILYGCMNYFSPDTGNYLFSAWVKEDTCCNPLEYIQNKIEITYTGSAATYDLYPEGKIIEGWQRYSALFHVPATAGSNSINVKLVALDDTCYFDDIRIQPIHATMKANVYDNRTLRLMAQLDDNNYATFYEYDDQGILIRIKKETEEGILTLQESRNSYVKK